MTKAELKELRVELIKSPNGLYYFIELDTGENSERFLTRGQALDALDNNDIYWL